MEVLSLDIATAKMVYNWYHKAYPEFYNNTEVQESETIMMKNLEEFLIKHGE